jgi:hypothetical protein
MGVRAFLNMVFWSIAQLEWKTCLWVADLQYVGSQCSRCSLWALT